MNTGSVRNWLAGDLTWKRRDAFIDFQPFQPIETATHAVFFHGAHDGVSTWFQGPCLAHAVELALHRDDLEEPFLDWIRSFKESLGNLEIQWQLAAEESERTLRRVWADAPPTDHGPV